MGVTVAFGKELPRRQPIPSNRSAFRILVIGDFGASRPPKTPVSVDRDDLDEVLQRMSVQIPLRLSENSAQFNLPISEFEDFHPDRLFENMDVFSALRTRRSRLSNDSTCREEIAAILNSGSASGSAAGESPSAGSSPGGSSSASGDSSNPTAGDLLSKVLSDTQASQKPLEQQVLEGRLDWDAWVRQLVVPYVVAKADPRKAEVLAGVDSAVAEAMRSVLHHPNFQRTETIWAGVRALTRRLETDRTLQLSVFQITWDELMSDLLADDDLTNTRLYKLLVESAREDGSDPWTMVVGDYQFGMNNRDSLMIARIAKICAAADSVFVSGGLPSIAGCPGFQSATDPREWEKPAEQDLKIWNAVRSLPESVQLSLVVPRLMARRPYGPETDSIESFPFNELPDGSQHDQYSWLNGAFGIACLIGQAFSRSGWQLDNAVADELDRWPFHVFVHDGDECIKPCSEVMLTDRAATTLAQYGLIVLRSVRDEDSVRVGNVRTLSANDELLTAQWE
jgi:type VI secretion system protein ImpC